MVQEEENEILAQFLPCIRHFIETLMIEGKVGICAGNIRVMDFFSGNPTLVKGPQCDRFKLFIPYAGHSLTWEVLFDGNHPEDPPDFIFGPDDEDFCPDLADLKNLVEWDSHNPRSLVLAMCELLDQYREYQQQMVERIPRLQFQYSTLLEQTDLTADQVELMMSRPEGKPGQVRFLVKLSVDFSAIPPYLTKDNPGEDSAVLLLTFQSPEGSRVSPQLFLSPRVEKALGGSSSMRIPSFPSGSSLAEYVPNVCQLLQNKVDFVVQGHEKKKEYIAAFLSHYGRSVLEYDIEGFSKISFLFNWHDFFFIIYIDLPMFFPREPPVFAFQSVYHESKGKPYMEVVTNYPYSPRWSGIEMAERARSFILDTISSFQKASVKSGSL